MNTLVMCIALVAGGIDAGWERRPEGGMEYIIQLNPETLESLQSGTPLQSDVQPSAGEVRSFRIVVGAKQLPREEPPTQFAVPKLPQPKEQPPAVAPNALTPGPDGKPIHEQRTVFIDSDAPTSKPQTEPTADVQPEQPAKPWVPLTLTLLGLFASVGANAYLGWITWELRRRFRATQPLVKTAEGY